MKIRVLTSIVALAVLVGVLLAPPIVFTVALAAVILMMLYECYKATNTDMSMKIVGFISAVLIMWSTYIFSAGNGSGTSLMIGVILLCVSAAVTIMLHMILVVAEHGKRSYKDILSNGFITLYVVLSMGCAWIAKTVYGTSTMLIIFVCAWSTDTCAYFAGRAFGKHKLIPHVSPNKTVEGSIGGIIGAILICTAYWFIASKLGKTPMLDWKWCIVYGAFGGALSQVGDLVASSIKRDTGIKDFGWIFPGHGGFMDRFDSVMFIAPILHFVMLAMIIIQGIGIN
jgi:phosphatidate cytidylyltransferase